ncbi:hypothetical protein FMEXI_5090 [Fusarium mexicanum]|uniref:Uncharacterized protein n=1 Tax=Fusarium mexicanum TaxID=751941 RepID=A0A8H5N0G0_9HYPO|nr:hypothetical protein FMEXI_5090 [Fusarium mexicanum]
MSETWDPDHALPAPYLSYKRQACDNENQPIDELWNERFRQEFSKSGHLQSESDKAEWVYWANHLKTPDSTKALYNHLLGKAGTGGKHRRMSWACICAVLCNPRWSEGSIRNDGKGKGLSVARTVTQRLYDRMRKKAKKAQKAKSFKSRDTGGEMKKLQDALHRRDRMIKDSDATIKLLKSNLSEQKELLEGSDPRIRSATLSPGPASSPTLSTGQASN